MAVFDRKLDQEIGKRLADRAGLKHETTSMDWSAESLAENRVLVRLETLLFLTAEEFNEILKESK